MSATMETLSYIKFKQEIKNMKSLVIRARVQMCRKLIADIKKLSQKKISDKTKNEKNSRKVQRLIEEIHTLKYLKPNIIANFALSHSEESAATIRESAEIEPKTKALAKVSLHQLIKPLVATFHKKYPDWENVLPELMKKYEENMENEKRNENEAEYLENSVSKVKESPNNEVKKLSKSSKKSIKNSTKGTLEINKINLKRKLVSNKNAPLNSQISLQKTNPTKRKNIKNHAEILKKKISKNKPEILKQQWEVESIEDFDSETEDKVKSVEDNFNFSIKQKTKGKVERRLSGKIENEENVETNEDLLINETKVINKHKKRKTDYTITKHDNSPKIDGCGVRVKDRENLDTKKKKIFDKTETEDQEGLRKLNKESKRSFSEEEVLVKQKDTRKVNKIPRRKNEENSQDDNEKLIHEKENTNELSFTKNENSETIINSEIECLETSRKKFSSRKKDKVLNNGNHDQVSVQRSKDEEELIEVLIKKKPKIEIENTKHKKDEIENENNVEQKQEDPFFLTNDNKSYMTFGKIVDEYKLEPTLSVDNKFINNSNNNNNYKYKTNQKSFNNLGDNKGWKSGNKFEKRNKFDRRRNETISVTENIQLHPSWAAKKKATTILPFQGKKISFEI